MGAFFAHPGIVSFHLEVLCGKVPGLPSSQYIQVSFIEGAMDASQNALPWQDEYVYFLF